MHTAIKGVDAVADIADLPVSGRGIVSQALLEADQGIDCAVDTEDLVHNRDILP